MQKQLDQRTRKLAEHGERAPMFEVMLAVRPFEAKSACSISLK
jgi:hypothetical protein